MSSGSANGAQQRVGKPTLDRKFVLGLSWNVTSTLLLQGLRMILTLYSAKVLGPENLGVWNLIALLVSYAPSLTFGVLNAMNREIPLLRAIGSDTDTERVIQWTLASILSAAGLISVGMLSASIATGEEVLAIACPFTVLSLLWVFTQCRLRAENDFLKLGKAQVVLCLGILLAFPGVHFWGVKGLLLGQTFSLVGALQGSIAPTLRALRPKSFSRVGIWGLTRSGFPIMFIGFLFMLFNSIDRLWVLRLGTREEFGVYGFCTSVSLIPQLLPALLADQMYPAMLRSWARRDLETLKQLFEKQLRCTIYITLTTGVAGWMIVPIVIPQFFPEYSSGTTSLLVLLFSPFGIGLAMSAGNLLHTIGVRRGYMVMLFAGCSAYCSAAAILSTVRFDPLRYAILSTLMATLLGLTLAGSAFRLLASGRLASEQKE